MITSDSPKNLSLNIRSIRDSNLISFFSVVHTLTHNFRDATQIVRTQLKLPMEPKHVLVKIIYAGVNASDVSPTLHSFTQSNLF